MTRGRCSICSGWLVRGICVNAQCPGPLSLPIQSPDGHALDTRAPRSTRQGAAPTRSTTRSTRPARHRSGARVVGRGRPGMAARQRQRRHAMTTILSLTALSSLAERYVRTNGPSEVADVVDHLILAGADRRRATTATRAALARGRLTLDSDATIRLSGLPSESHENRDAYELSQIGGCGPSGARDGPSPHRAEGRAVVVARLQPPIWRTSKNSGNFTG